MNGKLEMKVKISLHTYNQEWLAIDDDDDDGGPMLILPISGMAWPCWSGLKNGQIKNK